MQGLMPKSREWTRHPSDLEPGSWPPSQATLPKAARPRDATFFARFFGPLFPEIVARTWILYPPSFLSFPFDPDPDRDPQPAELESVYQHIQASTNNGCMVAGGQFLVRTANHLQELDDIFLGLPVPELDSDQLASLSSWRPECERPPGPLLDSVDICFGSYEGIWTVYSRHPNLLERVRMTATSPVDDCYFASALTRADAATAPRPT